MIPPESENYHKPYCPRCKSFVQPQVVSATTVSGTAAVVSHTTYKKFCPTCGEQVFSQSDRDANDADDAKQEGVRKGAQNWILVLGILAVVCVGPLAAIPALVLAVINRPLSAKGWVGSSLAILGLLLWGYYFFSKLR